MSRIRHMFIGIVTASLVTVTTQPTFGILVPLHSASCIPFSLEYPEHARKQVRAALETDDCRFVDGATAMRRSTLHFAGDTKSINEMLQKLTDCPGYCRGFFRNDRSQLRLANRSFREVQQVWHYRQPEVESDYARQTRHSTC